MKHKTCIVLSAAALGLRALALIAVLVMTVFQEPIKQIYNSAPEVLEIHSVPWHSILSAGLFLILSGIILLVLAKRPGRGGTIALTVVMAVLFGLFSAVLLPLLNLVITQAINRKGMMEIVSNGALTSMVGMVSPLFSTPATILSLLALGGACGKNFRREA